ncbi:hypothetical protein HAX54_003292, partial [Datura stramonium]|nr:hypothetical protein [Datura stramonium]
MACLPSEQPSGVAEQYPKDYNAHFPVLNNNQTNQIPITTSPTSPKSANNYAHKVCDVVSQ